MRVPIGLGLFLLGFAQVTGAAAGTLEEMRARNSLSVCAHPNALPYSSNLADTPGFYIELATALARSLDLRLEVNWVFSRADARFTNCDVFPGIAVLENARKDEPPGGKAPPLLHSRPYMTQRAVLVTRRQEINITTLDALRRLQVAVPSGSWAHVSLIKAEIPVLVRFHDDEEIIGAVVNGLADAGIVSEVGLGWYRRTHPDVTIMATEAPIADFHLDFDIGIGLRQSDYASLDRVNAIISRMEEDGTITAILERYGVLYHRPSRS